MSYIHQQKDWPNFRWNEARLLPLLTKLRHQQGRLLGQMEGLGFHLRGEANLESLTKEVIGSSAIEGEKLDAEEVRSSIARRLGIAHAGTTPASRNVEGVVEMMIDATRKYEEGLTAERLCSWHAALFPSGRSGMQRITVGSWRTEESGPMQVVSGPMGRERVHFEAPEASRLDAEISRFLEWFEETGAVDPVIKAGIAHFWFVTIHPFEDGNGRIARAIADMALARADGVAERFYSMSSQIERERKHYYDSLESSQRGGLDITQWLEWFLGCLYRALENAQENLWAILHKARTWERINQDGPVNERQHAVINRLLDGFEGKLSSSKYAKLAKCSPDTALRDIKELQTRSILIQEVGGGRSTSYRLAEPVGAKKST
ncbi:MAG: Fic family protein [Verrucomicrobia bacterium]|jgi:Fic family protein|nr:Fic family protein [Verrucomicrobiota bacterium]